MMEARILQAQGKTQMEIAEILGVTDRTIRNYLAERPKERINPVRVSKLDPYKEYLRHRIDDNPGINGELVFESLRKMGYTGKRSILKEYLTKLRRECVLVQRDMLKNSKAYKVFSVDKICFSTDFLNSLAV